MYKHTRGFLCENRWKKHQIFQKWDDFEARPPCRGCSPCKGYGPLQNRQFGSKIKMATNMRKTVSTSTDWCCCVQITAGKNTKYSWNETGVENRPSCKEYSHRGGHAQLSRVNGGGPTIMGSGCVGQGIYVLDEGIQCDLERHTLNFWERPHAYTHHESPTT